LDVCMELSSAGILLAFVASIALGRLLKVKIPEAAFKLVVATLVFTISLWASTHGAAVLLQSLVASAVMLALLTAVTLLLGMVIDRGSSGNPGGKARGRADPVLLLSIAGGWVAGLLVGEHLPSLISSAVTLEVYAVIIATGLTTADALTVDAVRKGGAVALKATVLSIVSALATGFLVSLTLAVPLEASLATMLGLGWYSFAGPFVAQVYGPAWGFTAFLTNVLREQLTFILVPTLRKPRVSMISLGGATTMDNTLPVYVYTYGEEASIPSIIHGFLLTLLTPFLESLVVSL